MKTVFLAAIFLALGNFGSVLFAQNVVLRAGDSIDVRIGGVPADDISQVSGNYQVDDQGNVNLPHIGRVRASGLNQEQLQQAIEGQYKSQQIYTNPSITVAIPQASRFVNVSGSVVGPRRVEFTSDLTALSAITAAGGFTQYADQTKVRLLRGSKVIMINVKEIRKDPSKDVQLSPGDSIEVPQSFW